MILLRIKPLKVIFIMNNSFCIKECPIGKEQSEKFLKENNSAIDAAIDMQIFVDECSKECPYKQSNKGEI